MTVSVGLDGQEIIAQGVSMEDYEQSFDGRDMRAFDSLPKVVRDALNATGRKWSAQDAVAALPGFFSANELARFIMQMDSAHMRQTNPYRKMR